METPEQHRPAPTPGGPSFQFSLKWLMTAVTGLAILLALGIATGGIVTGFLAAVFLRGVMPTVFVVGAIYARRDWRAFSIGAVVSCVPLLTTDIGPITGLGLLAGSIMQLFVAGICGVVAVAVRRWIVGRGLGPGEPL
jgi:hypothetical protein